jgi:NOL1/NOP2/sun family putative RNA methylase
MEKGRDFFISRYKKLGWEFQEVRVPQAIRVNSLRISNDKLIERLKSRGVELEKIDFLKRGFTVKQTKTGISALLEHLLGFYYIQEPASQLAAEILNPEYCDLVLDACAAPGGKTTYLSELMQNKGVIISIDKKKSRLIALKNNIERMGAKNVIVFNMDVTDADSLNLEFDKILLDSPCSGNFMQEERWFEKRDLEGVKNNAKLQRKLLEKCYSILKKGGVLVYSTCSLEPEENEENIEWFKSTFDVEVQYQKRFWPGVTQGFFICKMVKR